MTSFTSQPEILTDYVDKDIFYKMIENKLSSLGITEQDYPLNSIKLAQKFYSNLQIEFLDFKSINIGGILFKHPNISSMALNKSRSKKGRNFDCMHELIHFWFHPETEYLCTYLSNNDIQRKKLEWHANEGAAHALMPKNLFIRKYKEFKGEISKLSDFFFVGERAIAYRILNLGLDDKFIFLEDVNRYILKKFSLRLCPSCQNHISNINSLYCGICGQYLDTIIIKGDEPMNYYGYELDTNLKLKTCPRCLNTNIDESRDSCHICGFYLYNDCSNEFCGVTKLPGDTRHCPQCGSSTTFVQANILKNWEDSLTWELNKLKYEQNLSMPNGQIKELPNWNDFLEFLALSGLVYTYKILENSTAKICGYTLVIYTPKNIFKEHIQLNDTLNIITENYNSIYNEEFYEIEVVCTDDFYPIHEEPTTSSYDDIPF
ncbi:ImmA/IrrE family metallo-endopeptidase [Clostridium thermarum]|uniref:ImmA/IrrE family metallo-endopeptidase n=1 Tax=Clostridium thermarum TaxID=1716543 RepID=UPI0013CF6C3F|nr:ImmA/IrrE family metallo-endopeptidase [Clostridium thermarum]